ncbi:MAG: nitroreductase family protein [archaeon]|jgi:nitroreductase|nr:nitroreductase family protein [archaeon]
MDFDKVIQERKSVRCFKNKIVNFGTVIEAIDSAIQGPFAGNFNNLKFVIVESEKTIDNIAKQASQTWINQAPTLIIVCSEDMHLENQYGARGKDYARQQAGAAIATILMKLTDLGLSSCWVGAFNYEIVKEMLKIPAHVHIEAIIPVGYEKGSLKKPRKTPIEGVLRWENWNTTRRPPLFREAPMHGVPD